ncbi:7014_t:CDS:1, partial [Funneliformis geosporum]
DSLIKKFTKTELAPVMNDNKYHSLEESEMDPNLPEGKRIIVIKGLG